MNDRDIKVRNWLAGMLGEPFADVSRRFERAIRRNCKATQPRWRGALRGLLAAPETYGFYVDPDGRLAATPGDDGYLDQSDWGDWSHHGEEVYGKTQKSR